ncbi:hypothetical protein BDV25DRAFT_163024 [Aspergillus avenaceus]|uniref:Uncharacterized protein n=1 Tax=Aspergillus avenaceus TaxID=36643 RepID=A0A5N6TIG7_ASPAV|nr:hypothetical protein BDV25DRAFT_163024 [Aspergillus avenaceus]
MYLFFLSSLFPHPSLFLSVLFPSSFIHPLSTLLFFITCACIFNYTRSSIIVLTGLVGNGIALQYSRDCVQQFMS